MTSTCSSWFYTHICVFVSVVTSFTLLLTLDFLSLHEIHQNVHDHELCVFSHWLHKIQYVGNCYLEILELSALH